MTPRILPGRIPGPREPEEHTLENDALRVTVLPELGGHVSELVDLRTGRDLLWRNPRMQPRVAPYGAHFDDWWSGGWDEIFPSGDHGILRGEPLPYMGEMWCIPWSVEAHGDGDRVSLTATGCGTIAPVRYERTLTLRGDEPVLRVHYRLTSLDVRPLPFTWGIHPTFGVTPAHRIDHPGRSMLVGVASDPSMGEPGEVYEWPRRPDPASPEGWRDAALVRPVTDGVFGGHWVTDLADGWLALTDSATRRGVAVVFDRTVFPHAWLWQVYGGWRAHHHVALEPWTSIPMQLDGAIAAGSARELAPGESIETDLAFVVYEGLDRVTSVRRDGDAFSVA